MITTIAALALLVAESPAAPPSMELFEKARQHMAETLVNQPNYVCIETIERSERTNAKAKFQMVDSLRFEVAYLDHREHFAWPGSKRFDETSVLDLAPGGALIGTGEFAGHAYLLFRTKAPAIGAGSWSTEDGKLYARFPFTVPTSRSRYEVMNSRNDGEYVGYSGGIWIDSALGRVTRIRLHADEIPGRLGIASSESTIDYGPATIGERESWLPVQSTDEIVMARGVADRNVTSFSGCRAFTGESTLRFDDVPLTPSGSAVAAPLKMMELPAGIRFEVRFLDAIDSNKVHVGDPMRAELASSIKHEGEILFEKGSAVEMRLVRIQRSREATALVFAAGDVTSPTARARVNAVPSEDTRSHVLYSGGFPQMMGDPKKPGLITIFVQGNRLEVAKGYGSTWSTVPPLHPAAVVSHER
ncbi:MAG TPA: hypothetical protein VGL53_10895 [Bryobacteraceae bacterium]